MTRRSNLRASDVDRERIAELLRHATAEGRLLASELEDRLGAVFSARTYGELDATVADLPSRPSPGRKRARMLTQFHAGPALAIVFVLAFVIPIALALIVLAATIFATWAIVFAVALLLLGHSRRLYGVRRRRLLYGCASWHKQARSPFRDGAPF